MIRVLISARSLAEAEHIAAAGGDFIDLKEPNRGALGNLPIDEIAAIVSALRRTAREGQHRASLISATIGDLASHEREEMARRIAATAASGVDYVKVGVAPGAEAVALLEWLATHPCAIVPVLIADHGLDDARAEAACRLPFAAVMADTQAKHASLFDFIDDAGLARFVATARQQRKPVGLAGALRLPHLARLRALAPDFAGFRSAVCDGARNGALNPHKVAQLVAELHAAPLTA